MTTSIKAKFLCASAAVLLASQSASAAQLLFSPDGGTDGSGAIDTALPVSKISSVPVPRGSLVIHGDTAAIKTVPEWQFDPRTVLSGKVLDTRNSVQGSTTVITGVMFFDSGEWISYFDDKTALESVETSDNHTFVGRISSIADGKIVVTQVNGVVVGVPLNTVQQVRSPRAFAFSIPLTGLTPGVSFAQPLELDASRVAINQLGRNFRLAQLKSVVRHENLDGDVSSGKLVALGTFVSLANLAQLAPLLAIPLAREPNLERHAFLKNFVSNQTSMNQGK